MLSIQIEGQKVEHVIRYAKDDNEQKNIQVSLFYEPKAVYHKVVLYTTDDKKLIIPMNHITYVQSNGKSVIKGKSYDIFT
ncbi:hypothetical protein [Thermoactinomyces sp. DSM 45892]|uniref:hypothetical protein n=1 Tax=Thermoactinomyces sp. DSM 45892 TaxID=1882753 RepID=UPI00089CB588|nr:hypothetical protein [Thermoactinomyces sp. DSM 45892]SDY25303.1 hypothetical protein SAMN05444416_10399 [Thermoactinomyces sp. DSM 45892]